MLVRDNNGRHYPLSFYAPMSLHSFPSDNEAAYIRLYPVLDALSLLFLQPENLGASDALVDAGDALLDEEGILLRPGNGLVQLFRLRTSKSLKPMPDSFWAPAPRQSRFAKVFGRVRSISFAKARNWNAARLMPMPDLSSQADRLSLKTISD